jgi:hypothetical protein
MIIMNSGGDVYIIAIIIIIFYYYHVYSSLGSGSRYRGFGPRFLSQTLHWPHGRTKDLRGGQPGWFRRFILSWAFLHDPWIFFEGKWVKQICGLVSCFYCSSGWWFGTCFPYIGNVIIPTNFHIVQRGRYTTNQSCSLTEKLEDEEKNHQPSWVLGVHGAVHQFSRMVFQMPIWNDMTANDINDMKESMHKMNESMNESINQWMNECMSKMSEVNEWISESVNEWMKWMNEWMK